MLGNVSPCGCMQCKMRREKSWLWEAKVFLSHLTAFQLIEDNKTLFKCLQVYLHVVAMWVTGSFCEREGEHSGE